MHLSLLHTVPSAPPSHRPRRASSPPALPSASPASATRARRRRPVSQRRGVRDAPARPATHARPTWQAISRSKEDPPGTLSSTSVRAVVPDAPWRACRRQMRPARPRPAILCPRCPHRPDAASPAACSLARARPASARDPAPAVAATVSTEPPRPSTSPLASFDPTSGESRSAARCVAGAACEPRYRPVSVRHLNRRMGDGRCPSNISSISFHAIHCEVTAASVYRHALSSSACRTACQAARAK